MVAGTGNDSLLGICESLWRPDMVRMRLWARVLQGCCAA